MKRAFGRRMGAAAVVLQVASAGTSPLAFPGAEGFGQFASGGQGGEIFHVTSLDDSGPESFRDAVGKPGRVVVCDVGGIIGEGVDPQRFGSLTDAVTNITYTHNLWINNPSRNLKAKGRIQYVNNVVYKLGRLRPHRRPFGSGSFPKPAGADGGDTPSPLPPAGSVLRDRPGGGMVLAGL